MTAHRFVAGGGRLKAASEREVVLVSCASASTEHVPNPGTRRKQTLCLGFHPRPKMPSLQQNRERKDKDAVASLPYPKCLSIVLCLHSAAGRGLSAPRHLARSYRLR
jgi:hypothetical protein